MGAPPKPSKSWRGARRSQAQELRTSTLIRDHPIRGEDQRYFLGESEGSPPPPPQDPFPDAGEARNDFLGPFHETSYTAITLNTESDFYSPREESFPIPLKYIDVSRTTQTNLDVMPESRIDDYWNIDGSRDLFASWTGFTQFTLLSEKPPEGYMWSGERLTKRQATFQARSFMARTLERNVKER